MSFVRGIRIIRSSLSHTLIRRMASILLRRVPTLIHNKLDAFISICRHVLRPTLIHRLDVLILNLCQIFIDLLFQLLIFQFFHEQSPLFLFFLGSFSLFQFFNPSVSSLLLPHLLLITPTLKVQCAPALVQVLW